MDKALQVGATVIGLNDSGGARIQEGAASLAATLKFSKEMFSHRSNSQISVIMGPALVGLFIHLP